jgi:hypothetical protein
MHQPLTNGQQYGLLVGALTLTIAVVVVMRADGYRPLAWAALTASALITCYGWSVWQFPSEAMRVMAPTQVFLLIAALESFAPRSGAEGRVSCELDLRESSRTTPGSPAGDPTPSARVRSARRS